MSKSRQAGETCSIASNADTGQETSSVAEPTEILITVSAGFMRHNYKRFMERLKKNGPSVARVVVTVDNTVQIRIMHRNGPTVIAQLDITPWNS